MAPNPNAYYQNYDEAIQSGEQISQRQLTVPSPITPDILQNTYSNVDQQQNIYVNDEFAQK